MAGAVQSIEIGVPREQLFDVIVDYERYPEFLSDMSAAQIVRRDGPTVDVRFTLDLIKRLEYTLRLVGQRATGLSWTLVDGPFKKNEGGWTLEDLPGGRTRATYRIEIAVGMFLPGAIVNRLVGQTLPATLQAFKARAESLAKKQG